MGVNAHLRSRGDRILVGSKKEKFPAVPVLPLADFVCDVLPAVFPRSVLEPVRKNGEDDLVGALLRQILDPLLEALDRLPNRIQERSGATGAVGILVKAGHFAHGQVVARDLVFVIEEHQGDPGDAVDLLLFTEEFIEAGDSSLGMGVHRSGTVEDEGNFGDR